MTHHSSLCGVVLGLLCLFGALQMAASDRGSRFRHSLADSWPADSGLRTVAAEPRVTESQWWKAFEDPMLDSLIAIGEERNYDVAVAARRIEMARLAVKEAQSAYYPTVGVNAGYTRERSSGRLAGRTGDATTVGYFGAGATMNWEVDVFGKVRAQVNEAKANVKVSAAEFNATMLALDAEIATTYINLLVYRAQLQVAQNHSVSEQHIVDITETRHRTGLVSKLDVAQAKTLYYSTIAEIPLLESSIEAAYNSLAVLLGTTRAGLPTGVYSDHALPAHYQLMGLGAPLELLKRRPDVVEAERSIDVAAAELGIARSAYLPSLSIAATIGTQAHDFRDLFSGPSFVYSVAPTLSWTLFDGFSRRAATASAKQNLEISIDNYNMTVLTAVEEVRNAMATYSATLKYIERVQQVVDNSSEAVSLSLDQYKQGLTDFYNVSEAQLTYLTYQNTLVSARGQALTALIDLYKALGGNYQE